MNVNILRVVYNQYFCNIGELTDQQLLTVHNVYVEAVTRNEDAAFYEISDDLVIWEPFEWLSPAKVLDNIFSGITDIELSILPPDCIAVNPLELASELAHNRLLEENLFEDTLWEVLPSGDKIYKDNIQDEFNEFFDYYMQKITGV